MSVPGLAHPPTLKESQMPSVLLQTDPAPKRCALETFDWAADGVIDPHKIAEKRANEARKNAALVSILRCMYQEIKGSR